jgi:hypothetical protein
MLLILLEVIQQPVGLRPLKRHFGAGKRQNAPCRLPKEQRKARNQAFF